MRVREKSEGLEGWEVRSEGGAGDWDEEGWEREQSLHMHTGGDSLLRLRSKIRCWFHHLCRPLRKTLRNILDLSRCLGHCHSSILDCSCTDLQRMK